MNQSVKTALIEKFLSNHSVTKCPPGSVEGANDLKNWAKIRFSGRSYLSANDNNLNATKRPARYKSR